MFFDIVRIRFKKKSITAISQLLQSAASWPSGSVPQHNVQLGNLHFYLYTHLQRVPESCPYGKRAIQLLYLVRPSVLVPGRQLQHPDDFVNLRAHFLKSEVSVFQGLFHAVAARCLCGHKDFDA